ncbi:MAG TPA: CarD family transcriptional regulator, partial [Longimicrobiaceae bacterium]|nr:CarD family transcriptional regulator [Longimicrobiaceae bacterium]
ATANEMERTWAEVQRLHTAEVGRGGKPEAPETLFLPPPDAVRRLAAFPQLYVEEAEDAPVRAWHRFAAAPPEIVDRDMQRLGELLRGAAGRGEHTLILCDNQGQLERLQELLDELRIGARAVTLGIGSLMGGFVLGDAEPPLRVLTDHEVFRRTRRIRRRRRFRGGAALESVAALKPGDYVVHMDHGIGQFRRMERVRLGEEEFETLVIEYAGGELLRVPVHRVDLIERWVPESDDAPPPKVHRIGGKDWARAKQRTQKAIQEMTAELLSCTPRAPPSRASPSGPTRAGSARWSRPSCSRTRRTSARPPRTSRRTWSRCAPWTA